MKVKDLIKILKTADPESEILTSDNKEVCQMDVLSSYIEDEDGKLFLRKKVVFW